MNDVSLRTATSADIAAITRIYAHAVACGTASFELEPPDETEMARRQQALLARNFPYIVAELAGAVVVYAYAGPYRDRRAYEHQVPRGAVSGRCDACWPEGSDSIGSDARRG